MIIYFPFWPAEMRGKFVLPITETHPRRVTSRFYWTLPTKQNWPKHSSNFKSGTVMNDTASLLKMMVKNAEQAFQDAPQQ